MVFTPPASFVVRSREYGDGSEYDMESDSQVMPDHYVKRLWRQRAMASAEGRTVQFINKDSVDRTVLYSAVGSESALLIKKGAIIKGGEEVARVVWDSENNLDRSKRVFSICGRCTEIDCPLRVSLESKTGPFKEMLKKGGSFASASQSRIFVGPDGLDYKWKVVLEGSNPIFPEATFRDLHRKDMKHPLATTARLVKRDGEPSDETYPIYIAQDALWLESWIVATLMILETWDRLQG
ncbi:hypothetical protein BDZ89DRAFT_1127882 [Hymenopellis radicata]|nr:hypothetical protein BDZ89DRAFT_1127882 [Hymenopellis radicata]